jgi:hypothetical protein
MSSSPGGVGGDSRNTTDQVQVRRFRVTVSEVAASALLPVNAIQEVARRNLAIGQTMSKFLIDPVPVAAGPAPHLAVCPPKQLKSRVGCHRNAAES